MKMNRRDLLQMSAGLCLASALPKAAFAEEEGLKLKTVPLQIEVGSTKPFRAIHISDTHFCLADERETERKRKMAASRMKYFGDSRKWFDAAAEFSRKNDAIFMHTGDLIDFVSESNYEAVEKHFKGLDSFAAAGNHEFSHYLGEAKEDAAYKALSYERAQRSFPNDLTFCSRVVNGVNFIAIDDVYYNFTARQLELFKAEIEKGLPIVMLCHVPLFTQEFFDFGMGIRKLPCAYVTGAPESLMGKYAKHRREQQKPDEETQEFLAWLKEQSLLKAILCGHMHFYWSGPFSKSAMQYIVGANFTGAAHDITFV